ncbi:MAG: 3-oxoacyl-[acyl-carrier-protein] synthase III [Pseudoalteromonas tetraodonis]|jgi:3-oxoacyl-[acyl-carrier-protein] synthase III
MDMRITPKIRILSVGSFLPSNIIKSNDLFDEIKSETFYNTPRTWMSEKVGIVERRASSLDDLPSSLALPAAQQALEACENLNPDDIDLVIFCGIERDQPEPATAHTINHQLGLKAKHCFDLANACYGFMEAMQTASMYIKAGETKKALIVTGEISTHVMRKVVDELKQGIDPLEARKKLGALTVGDAGGAVIMGESYGYDCPGFELFNTTVDSSHGDKCTYRHNKKGGISGQMLMGPISKAVVSMQQGLFADTMKRLGWEKADWVISHQMGKPPFDRIQKMSGVEETKMIKTYPHLGNITSATFAVNYHNLMNNGSVRAGDKVLGCFAGSGLAIGQVGYTI